MAMAEPRETTQADEAHTATTWKTGIKPGPVACHAGSLSLGWGQFLTEFPPSPTQMATVALRGRQEGGFRLAHLLLSLGL